MVLSSGIDVVWRGSEFAPPAPGHSSLETMTEPDYDNDLVFRSGGKEYARIGGNGEWKPQAPPVEFEISAEDVVAGVPFTDSSIDLRGSTEEIIRVDQEGFHYNGQFIADAGEAHRLLVEFLKKHTA